MRPPRCLARQRGPVRAPRLHRVGTTVAAGVIDRTAGLPVGTAAGGRAVAEDRDVPDETCEPGAGAVTVAAATLFKPGLATQIWRRYAPQAGLQRRPGVLLHGVVDHFRQMRHAVVDELFRTRDQRTRGVRRRAFERGQFGARGRGQRLLA